jgi:isoleucyl-tRNA synthetase
MVRGLCQMLSPMIAFTADEAWEFIPGAAGQSVHETDWKPTDFALSAEERKVWADLFKLREQVLPELEKARQAKTIGKALDAQVKLGLNDGVTTWVVDHLLPLQELLNVSQIKTVHQPATAATGNDLQGFPSVEVLRAEGEKCERCWHYETDVGSHKDHATICARCVAALESV